MNEVYISLSELLDLYYTDEISKGLLKKTILAFCERTDEKHLFYADTNFYSLITKKSLVNLSKDLHVADKFISKYKTEQMILFREFINGMEFVTKLILTNGRKPVIDTLIFIIDKKKKVKSFWFSQMKNFEQYLSESDEVSLRIMDVPMIDLEETPKKVLIIKEDNKILKRFKNLDID